MSHLQLACEGYLAHDALDQRRLALAVLADEGYLFAALDGQVDVVEHGVCAVVLAYFVADDGIVAASQTGRKLQVHGRVVYLVHLDGDYLLQLFHLLLHLHGLGGLIAETLDEGPHVGYFLLLVLVGAQLLFAALAAQHDVLVVLHLVVYDASAGYLQRAVGDIIDKCPVVADQHDGAGRLAEKLFEPLYGVNVQMVGRLVEQQHVGTLEQYLGQLDAHAPTAGELARGPVEVCALEAQSRQGALQLGLLAVGTGHHVAVVLLRETLHQGHVLGTLVVGALGHLLLQTVHAFLHPCYVGKGFPCLLAHGGVVLQYHDLGQIAYACVVGYADGAAGGLLLSAEYLEQRRLAGTVLAHQGYAVAVVHHEAGVGKQGLDSELYSQGFD